MITTIVSNASLLCDMALKCAIFLLTLAAFALPCEPAKILGIFHYPSKSHHILGSILLKELAKRGHEVTMLSPFIDENPPPNYKNIHLSGILEVQEELLKEYANANFFQKLFKGYKLITTVCERVLHHPNMTKLLQSNETFDVVILFWTFSESLVGVANQFNAPIIGFSPTSNNFFVNYYTGNPSPYSYIPNYLMSFSDHMTFFERTVNTILNLLGDLSLAKYGFPYHEKLYKEVFPNGESLETLLKNIVLYFVNSHDAIETPRPRLPNVIQIGGFHLQENQTIPKDLKNYLDNAKEGVILVSFGTNVKKGMMDNMRESIVKALLKQKLKVLWKYDEYVPEVQESNVRVEKWVPQKAVLCHPNVKLFVSHGGLGGMSETIYCGVPFVGIPFYGDQEPNIKFGVRKEIAVMINRNEVTESTLTQAINEVLYNNRYKENIQKISSIYRNQPVNPMDKAIYWVEYVIKHKWDARQLRSAASDMPLYQYYLLDVIAFLVTISILGMVIFVYIVKLLFRCIFKSRKRQKLNKTKSKLKKR